MLLEILDSLPGQYKSLTLFVRRRGQIEKRVKTEI